MTAAELAETVAKLLDVRHDIATAQVLDGDPTAVGVDTATGREFFIVVQEA